MAEETLNRKMRILVVDDDRELTSGFIKLLEGEEFEVHGFYSGKSALDAIQERPYEFAFIDGLLPGIDGFKLCEEIRWIKHSEKMPIVMMSGVYRASTSAVEARQKYKLLDYLEKPIAPAVIIKLLRKHFGNEYPKPLDMMESDGFHSMINTYFMYDATNLPLIGRLEAVPLPVLLNQIWARKLTGQMLISWKKAKKIVSFEKGRPVSVSSNIIGECLGQQLLKDSVIDQNQLDASLEIMKQVVKRQGEVLLQMHAISSLQLAEALRRQFEIKLFSVFQWQDASYSFKALEALPSVPSKMDLHPYTLIRNGVMQHVTVDRLQLWLKPYQSAEIHATENCESLMREGGFNLKETRFAQNLDGLETLKEVLETPFKRKDDMAAFIFTLIAIRAVQLGQPKEDDSEVDGETKVFNGEREESLLVAHAHHLRDINQVPTERNDISVMGASGKTRAMSKEDIERLELMQILQRLTPEQKGQYQRLYEFYKKNQEKNYFEIFDSDRQTPIEQIKKRFLELAKTYHPDTIAHQDVPEIRRLADEIFTLLSKAHENLTNKKKRAEYMEYLSGGGNEDATEEVAKILASEEHFMEAKTAIKRKDWTAAKRSLLEALKLNSNEGEYYCELGWAHFNLSANDMVSRQEAIKYLEKAIEVTPRLADPHFYLGSIYKSVGDLGKSVDAFRECLRIDPKHHRAKSEMRLLKMRREEEVRAKAKGGLFSRFKK